MKYANWKSAVFEGNRKAAHEKLRSSKRFSFAFGASINYRVSRKIAISGMPSIAVLNRNFFWEALYAQLSGR